MSFLRSTLTALTILGLVRSFVQAQAVPPVSAAASGECYAAVKADYDAARKRWSQENRAANEARKRSGEVDIAEKTGIKPFEFAVPLPGPEFSPRFLAVAEKNPEGPEALDAIKMAHETGKSANTRAKAIKILADHYTTSPRIRDLLRQVAWSDEPEARALIDDVIARNPDRSLHVAALQRRAQRLGLRMRVAENLKKPDAVRALAERPQFKDHVAETLAAGEKARAELATIERILGEKYADMVADVRIGSRMGPLVSEDLEGKTVGLADFKGKVVVLDVWATWCGPCRAMIPHERELVARLKDKPFALISISVDAEKKTLTDFLAREPMPWHHWWNGAEGKLKDRLSIENYPTVFVLDADGVVRFNEIRGEELENAVNELLKETEKKTAGPTRATAKAA